MNDELFISAPSVDWLVPFLLLGLRERDSYGHELVQRMPALGLGVTHPRAMHRALRHTEEEGLNRLRKRRGRRRVTPAAVLDHRARRGLPGVVGEHPGVVPRRGKPVLRNLRRRETRAGSANERRARPYTSQNQTARHRGRPSSPSPPALGLRKERVARKQVPGARPRKRMNSQRSTR